MAVKSFFLWIGKVEPWASPRCLLVRRHMISTVGRSSLDVSGRSKDAGMSRLTPPWTVYNDVIH